jgi:hypothetical protein
MIDADTTFYLGDLARPQSPKLFQKAVQISKAFVSTHEAPTIIVTAWLCELLGDMIVAHLRNRVLGKISRSDNVNSDRDGIFSYLESSDPSIDVLHAVGRALGLFFTNTWAFQLRDAVGVFLAWSQCPS